MVALKSLHESQGHDDKHKPRSGTLLGIPIHDCYWSLARQHTSTYIYQISRYSYIMLYLYWNVMFTLCTYIHRWTQVLCRFSMCFREVGRGEGFDRAYPAARQDGPVDRQVPCLGTGSVTTRVPSGKRLHSYWKWWFIVDVPIKNGDFPELCKRLPEGNLYQVNHQRQCKERIAGKSEPGDIPTSQVMKLRQLRSWTKMVTWPTGHI